MTSLLDRGIWWAATVAVWFIAAITVLVGVVFVLISILGFIDPAGTKMADDNDPFGIPPSALQCSVLLVVSLGITVMGFLIPLGYHHFFKKPQLNLPSPKNA